jgi:hypothetical protein
MGSACPGKKQNKKKTKTTKKTETKKKKNLGGQEAVKDICLLRTFTMEVMLVAD